MNTPVLTPKAEKPLMSRGWYIFSAVAIVCSFIGMMAFVNFINEEDEANKKAAAVSKTPEFDAAYKALRDMAHKGCKIPFDDCSIGYAKSQVLAAMEKEKIGLGSRPGASIAEVEDLGEQAQTLIAGQMYTYIMDVGVYDKHEADLFNKVCVDAYLFHRAIPGFDHSRVRTMVETAKEEVVGRMPFCENAKTGGDTLMGAVR